MDRRRIQQVFPIQDVLILVYWIIPRLRWRLYYLRMHNDFHLGLSHYIFKLYRKSSLHGQQKSHQLGHTTGNLK